MHDIGQIESARLAVDRLIEKEGVLPEDQICIPESPDPWEVAILRESNELYKFTSGLIQLSYDLYSEDLRARVESAGRVVELAFPVQLSGGIVRMSRLIGVAEQRLDEFEQTFREFADQAEFNDGSPHDEASRFELSLSKKLIERQRLHLHTYLWVLWIQESLEQANQFGAVVQNPNHLPEHPEGSFQYIAHPPLVVATLSTTAMIEEIGGTYINKQTNESVDLENTRCSDVLNKLERCYPKIEQYDINAIRTNVVDTRNDFSHYITKRGNAITLNNFEEYYLAIHQALSLVKELADQLIMELIAHQDLTVSYD